jgi:lipopolysaccharide biosynthesis glycosyltransferase
MKNNLAIGSPDSFSQIPKQQKTRNVVCLCTDRRMMIPALFVAEAVKSHSGASDNRFDTFIFAEPPEVTDVYQRWMEERDILLCDDMDLSRQQGVGKFSGRLSPATLMKLSLAEHLAGQYEKILYLDCDLTIHDDVASLFSLDTAPFALAAVPSGRILVDLSEKQRKELEDQFHDLGMTKPYRFFNTGVLYIDVARWNSENLGNRTLDFIRQNPDLCSLPDEHALNAILDGNIAELSPIWNMRPPPRWRKGALNIARPVIIHHAGDNKPWRRFCYGKGLFPDLTAYRLYKDFLRNSPWPKWLSEQWGWCDFYLNIRGEIGRIVRRLMGTLEEPSAEQRREYCEAVRRFYADERFVDVDQGIVIRENGKIRLKTRAAGR